MTTSLDPWSALRRLTRARIGLGRTGDALPTRAQLDFQMAHALARDAVHSALDVVALATSLAPLETLQVESAATDRTLYLRRPDLGRQLGEASAARLPSGPFDVVIILADGLSAIAVEKYAGAVLGALLPSLSDLTIGPIVLATQARVALGDPVAQAMKARLVLVLIGERPGLTVADSLGAYLTFAPQIGSRDSARNCVSNIHADGLSPREAAHKLAWLIRQSLHRGLSGIDLKEAAPPSLAALP